MNQRCFPIKKSLNFLSCEDASVSNVFAASAFRFGHTMVNPELRRLGPDFSPIAEGNLPLSQAFFRDRERPALGSPLFASGANLAQPNFSSTSLEMFPISDRRAWWRHLGDRRMILAIFRCRRPENVESYFDLNYEH